MILGWEQPEATGLGFTPSAPTGGGGLIEDSGTHLLAIAATGQGKGRNLAIPNLLHYDGPAIVLDVKGELAAVTARYRRDVLGHEIVVLDPWGRTRFDPASFNPLSVVGSGPGIADDCYQLASLLTPPASGSLTNEAFWTERGEAIIAGVMGHVLTDPMEANRTLARVHDHLAGTDPIYGLATALNAYDKTMPPFAYQQIAAFLHLPDITRGGVLATALSHMQIMSGALV